MKELAIVMPAYNEEEIIGEVVTEVHDEILAKLPGSELLVVNDGSRDNTGAILDELAGRLEGVRVLHKPNGGHGAAVLHGLEHAEAKHLFLMDSDGQFVAADFWKLWELREEYDLLIGSRVERHDPVSRKILTVVVRLAIWAGFGTYIHDSNCPFKLMKTGVWQSAKPHIPADTLAPSIFIAILACKMKYRLKTVGVKHLARETGVCSIRYMNLIRFCARALGQLAGLRLRMLGGVKRADG
jgi:glycosyltransferase involved in cell wall biosynthesis